MCIYVYIMFSFVYEDPEIEINAIKEYLKKYNKNYIESGLMILSGGCTMFEIAPYFTNLIATDLNNSQIEWVNKKIFVMNTDIYKDLLENSDFVFDKMFKNLKYDSFENIFSKDNLIKNFGTSAVENTTEDFAEHFKSIYDKKGIYHDWIFNRNYKEKNKIYDINSIKKVKIMNDKIEDLLLPNSYDFIQTSNITDWMGKLEFENIVKKLKLALKPNGILIMRRLLSDNILENNFNKNNFNKNNISSKIDKTLFYKETIIYHNLLMNLLI
jgi:S-adenosylmethionine:diacylglycerol 3-amino-3-carboxypropyl transferase